MARPSWTRERSTHATPLRPSTPAASSRRRDIGADIGADAPGAGAVMTAAIGVRGASHLSMGLSQPSGIAVDATTVYFATSGDGKIHKVAIGGGADIELASGQASPASVLVDGGFVYWTNYVASG